MTNEAARQLIDALTALLDRERTILIRGELERLPDMMAEKETLIVQINDLADLGQVDLAAIRDKVSRNQNLLTSALDGIRAVADRMAELRRVRKGLETYDRTGRKTRFDTLNRSSVEKRA